MIRAMKSGEEDKIRELIAKLSHENKHYRGNKPSHWKST
jgi:hypothetical protein